MKPGLYETVYGNTAKVSSPTAKTALDLDMQERIPIALVDEKRPLPGKVLKSYSMGYPDGGHR